MIIHIFVQRAYKLLCTAVEIIPISIFLISKALLFWLTAYVPRFEAIEELLRIALTSEKKLKHEKVTESF